MSEDPFLVRHHVLIIKSLDLVRHQHYDSFWLMRDTNHCHAQRRRPKSQCASSKLHVIHDTRKCFERPSEVFVGKSIRIVFAATGPITSSHVDPMEIGQLVTTLRANGKARPTSGLKCTHTITRPKVYAAIAYLFICSAMTKLQAGFFELRPPRRVTSLGKVIC